MPCPVGRSTGPRPQLLPERPGRDGAGGLAAFLALWPLPLPRSSGRCVAPTAMRGHGPRPWACWSTLPSTIHSTTSLCRGCTCNLPSSSARYTRSRQEGNMRIGLDYTAAVQQARASVATARVGGRAGGAGPRNEYVLLWQAGPKPRRCSRHRTGSAHTPAFPCARAPLRALADRLWHRLRRRSTWRPLPGTGPLSLHRFHAAPVRRARTRCRCTISRSCARRNTPSRVCSVLAAGWCPARCGARTWCWPIRSIPSQDIHRSAGRPLGADHGGIGRGRERFQRVTDQGRLRRFGSATGCGSP